MKRISRPPVGLACAGLAPLRELLPLQTRHRPTRLLEAAIRTTIHPLELIAVMIVLAVCSFSSVKAEDIGVWKPTGLVGAYAPAGEVALGPQGNVWTFVGAGDGSRVLVRSTDSGASWTTVTLQTSARSVSTRRLLIDSQNRLWVFVAEWGLSRFSADGDLLTTTGLAETPGDFTTHLIESPDGYLYRMRWGGNGEVFDRISKNGDVRTTSGYSWREDLIRDLQVDAKGALYVLGSILSRSTDGGLTWTELFSWSRYEEVFDSLCVEPDGRTLYVDSRWYYFFRSTDAGAHWTKLPRLTYMEQSPVWPLPDGTVAMHAHVYPWDRGKYPYGILRSRDKGNTWVEFMPGIQKEDFQTLLAVGSFANFVYVHISFAEGSQSPTGLYRLVLPQTKAGEDWPKY